MRPRKWCREIRSGTNWAPRSGTGRRTPGDASIVIVDIVFVVVVVGIVFVKQRKELKIQRD